MQFDPRDTAEGRLKRRISPPIKKKPGKYDRKKCIVFPRQLKRGRGNTTAKNQVLKEDPVTTGFSISLRRNVRPPIRK